MKELSSCANPYHRELTVGVS